MTLDERERYFRESHIGDRTRESLIRELFSVYLALRSNCKEINVVNIDDPWPASANLADVLERYVLR